MEMIPARVTLLNDLATYESPYPMTCRRTSNLSSLLVDVLVTVLENSLEGESLTSSLYTFLYRVSSTGVYLSATINFLP